MFLQFPAASLPDSIRIKISQLGLLSPHDQAESVSLGEIGLRVPELNDIEDLASTEMLGDDGGV
jgi:hypothetical protein